MGRAVMGVQGRLIEEFVEWLAGMTAEDCAFALKDEVNRARLVEAYFDQKQTEHR